MKRAYGDVSGGDNDAPAADDAPAAHARTLDYLRQMPDLVLANIMKHRSIAEIYAVCDDRDMRARMCDNKAFWTHWAEHQRAEGRTKRHAGRFMHDAADGNVAAARRALRLFFPRIATAKFSRPVDYSGAVTPEQRRRAEAAAVRNPRCASVHELRSFGTALGLGLESASAYGHQDIVRDITRALTAWRTRLPMSRNMIGTGMEIATKTGNAELLEFFLERRRPDKMEWGNMIFWAAQCGFCDVLERLLQLTPDGDTEMDLLSALREAVVSLQPCAVALFLRYGVGRKSDVGEAASHGLQYATHTMLRPYEEITRRLSQSERVERLDAIVNQFADYMYANAERWPAAYAEYIRALQGVHRVVTLNYDWLGKRNPRRRRAVQTLLANIENAIADQVPVDTPLSAILAAEREGV